MRRPPRHVDEDRERAAPQQLDDDDDEAKLDWCSPERSWTWLLCLGACIFYFAYQSEPRWPDRLAALQLAGRGGAATSSRVVC